MSMARHVAETQRAMARVGAEISALVDDAPGDVAEEIREYLELNFPVLSGDLVSDIRIEETDDGAAVSYLFYGHFIDQGTARGIQAGHQVDAAIAAAEEHFGIRLERGE